MFSAYHKLSLMTLAMVCVALLPGLVQGDSIPAYSSSGAPCTDCHLCAKPTKDDPCLKSCPGTVAEQSNRHATDEGPGLIVLGTTGTLYEPVNFNHRSHADMGQMGAGCVSCHHYTANGKMPPCSDCHLKPTTLGQPGLKGAYHRQCLGCHRQWSGTNDCVNCHVPVKNSSSTATTTKAAERDPEPISEPAVKVYDVKNSAGDKVTFYHNDHVEKFGVECVTCHQRESCGYCHDKNADKASMKSPEQIHAICNDCHDGDNCGLCHGKKEKTPFQHDAAHWRLGDYHNHLACNECHVVGQRIKSLKSDCVECHDDWSPDNFDHAVTGLKLDETHRELDCADCHLNEKYHQPPSCVDCHDNDRSPDKDVPGMKVGLKFENNSGARGKD